MDDQSLVVLTVFSLLSQANGLSRDVVGGEQNEMITGVTLGSTFGEMDSVIVADKVLATQPFATGDLLAITVPNSAKDRLGAFPLAKESPAVGTQVWLSAALYAGAPASQRQHLAVITGVDEHARLTYKFDNSAISFEGTAGAPILNSQGKLWRFICQVAWKAIRLLPSVILRPSGCLTCKPPLAQSDSQSI